MIEAILRPRQRTMVNALSRLRPKRKIAKSPSKLATRFAAAYHAVVST